MITSKNSSTDDRLVGVERRITNLEKEISEFRFEILRNTNSQRETQDAFIKMEDRFMAAFEKFRSDIYTLIDPITGQLKTFNEEQTLHEGQHEEIYQEVQKLKQIHPKNTHLPVVA